MKIIKRLKRNIKDGGFSIIYNNLKEWGSSQCLTQKLILNSIHQILRFCKIKKEKYVQPILNI